MTDLADLPLERPGPNLAAAIALFEQQSGEQAKTIGWAAFRERMYRLVNRYPRNDVIPEEAAHVWLEALGLDVPDPSCGRGRAAPKPGEGEP
jgi:hypothetical protein